MRYRIVAFIAFVILLIISFICLQHEKERSCAEPVKIKDISFIYFRTNEENTKGLLSFCLCDESEQFVTMQIQRYDDHIHICLWRGEEVYHDVDQNMMMLIPKAPLPGLTQSIVKDGKEVEAKATIYGFSVEFDINHLTPEKYVTLGGKRISLKDRGVVRKAPGSPRFITSWPIVWK